jgi:transcriptional regulator with XRE-family HTH domain
METQIYFNKNLKYLRRQNNRQTQENLAKALGLTRSVISSYEDGRAEPSIATLTKVSDYFQVSIEILTNIDLSNANQKDVEYKIQLEKYASARQFEIKTVSIEIEKQRHISLVPQRASAGYSNGYADTEYLKELPTYQLPFLDKQKEYRAFEIQGDSMLPIPDKSIVIGEYIENISEIREGEKCIIVSEVDGVVFKQVFNKVGERDTLLLKSSNIAYSPYEIKAKDVLEMWKFTAYIHRDFPQEYDTTDSLKEAFSRMEHQIQDLKIIQDSQKN